MPSHLCCICFPLTTISCVLLVTALYIYVKYGAEFVKVRGTVICLHQMFYFETYLAAINNSLYFYSIKSLKCRLTSYNARVGLLYILITML